jgi:hypothetical protein
MQTTLGVGKETILIMTLIVELKGLGFDDSLHLEQTEL